MLARVAERMRVRDDEDLAIEQLRAGPAPGRADDTELRERAGPPAAVAGRQDGERGRLLAIRDELSALRSQRAALPVRELRELDAIEADMGQVAEQRDELAARVECLPPPDRTRLGRGRDDHAAERGRILGAIGVADQQLAALARQRDELAREAGPLGDVRAERDGLERRMAGLERDQRQLGDRLAERELTDPPAWARQTFGDKPTDPRAAEKWDCGVLTVARYRIQHDVPDTTPGLGPPPDALDAVRAWREASTIARQVQRRLDRSLGRDTGHGHER